MDDDINQLISKWDLLQKRLNHILATDPPPTDTPVNAVQLKAANENVMSARRDLTDLRERITRNAVTDAQLEIQKSTYAQQLQVLTSADASKSAQIHSLQEKLRKLSQMTSENIGSMKAKNSKLVERIAQLQHDLDQANITLQDKDKTIEKCSAAIEQIRRSYESQLNEVQARNDATISKMSASRDSKIARLENDLKQANASLRERDAILAKAIAAKLDIQAKYDTRLNDAQRQSDARINELLAERDAAVAELANRSIRIRDEFQRRIDAKVRRSNERTDEVQRLATDAVYDAEIQIVDMARRQNKEVASLETTIDTLRHSQECASDQVKQLEAFNQRLNTLLDEAITADHCAKSWSNELRAIAKQETKNTCQLRSLLTKQNEKNKQLQDALNESLKTNIQLRVRLEDAGAEFHQASAAQAQQHQKQLTQLQDEHDSLTALRDNELEQKIHSALAQKLRERDEVHRRENAERDRRFDELQQLVSARLRASTHVSTLSGRDVDVRPTARTGSRSTSRYVTPGIQSSTSWLLSHEEPTFGRTESRVVSAYRASMPDDLPALYVSEQSMPPPRVRGGASPEFPESSPVNRRSNADMLYGIEDFTGQHDADHGDQDATLIDLTGYPSSDTDELSNDSRQSPRIDETPFTPRRNALKRPAEDELESTVQLRRPTAVSTPALHPTSISTTNGQANSSARRVHTSHDERIRRPDQIWDLMHKDWDITLDEETKLREQLSSLFSRGRSIDKVKEAIDKHVVGSFREYRLPPRPCLLANLTGENGGKGGTMTSGSCPYCKNKSHRVCVWADYAPGVASGFGERNEAGVITDQTWDPNPNPATVNVDGQQVRWYLKKRRDPVSRA